MKLLYNTTPIHCTTLPLHPPVMNTHNRPLPRPGAPRQRVDLGETPRASMTCHIAYLPISLSLSLYIYIYIHTHLHTDVSTCRQA